MQHLTSAVVGSSSSPATKQQQDQWRQLQVLYVDEHLAVVVKPFGLHIYGRGIGHLKHWLSQALPASSAGEIAGHVKHEQHSSRKACRVM
jgi:23S rRNA-/tRNA-specific pseudouridylate synthase